MHGGVGLELMKKGKGEGEKAIPFHITDLPLIFDPRSESNKDNHITSSGHIRRRRIILTYHDAVPFMPVFPSA
jgi:hypothetical protein